MSVGGEEDGEVVEDEEEERGDVEKAPKRKSFFSWAKPRNDLFTTVDGVIGVVGVGGEFESRCRGEL